MHQEGDTVRCVSARGYVLTTGKEYKVLGGGAADLHGERIHLPVLRGGA